MYLLDRRVPICERCSTKSKARHTKLYARLGIRGFCSTFGILIALLWEETASICHPDITADDDQQVVPSRDKDYLEPISTLQSLRPLISALSTDHVDSDEMVRHRSPDAREQKGGDSLNSNPEEELITARRLPQSAPTSISGLPCATSPPSPSSSPMSPPHIHLYNITAAFGMQRKTST